MWQTTGILVAVIFSGLLIVVGDFAQDWILPKQSRSWGVSLALGILATSVTGALLAAFHALRFSSVAALFLAAAYCGWLRRHLLLKRVQQECEEFSSRAKFPTLLALEGLFLVTVFVWVSASPPESRYDAMIRYWPYLKLLKLESGFFDLPYQWNYIIPQGGLSYAACFYLLFGEAGLR
jgi:hypothetical protein